MNVSRPDLNEGTVVNGKFIIVKNIGRGSYGDVLLVQSPHGRFAMKVLRLYDIMNDVRENLVKYFSQNARRMLSTFFRIF